MSASLALSLDPTSPRRARSELRTALAEDQGLSASRVSDAELLVSELVSNAMRHARTEATLVLDHHPGYVRAEVIDYGPGTPRRLNPEPLAESGRGLAFVANLSDRWGVEQGAGWKSVWFEIGGSPR